MKSKKRRASAYSGSEEDEVLPSQHRKRAIDAMEGRLATLAGEVSALQRALEDLRKHYSELAAEGELLDAQLRSQVAGAGADGAQNHRTPQLRHGLHAGTHGSDMGNNIQSSWFTSAEPASPGGHFSADLQNPPNGKSPNATDTRSTGTVVQTGPTDIFIHGAKPLFLPPQDGPVCADAMYQPAAGVPDFWDDIMMANCHEHDPTAEAGLVTPESGMQLAAGSTTGSPVEALASAGAAAAAQPAAPLPLPPPTATATPTPARPSSVATAVVQTPLSRQPGGGIAATGTPGFSLDGSAAPVVSGQPSQLQRQQPHHSQQQQQQQMTRSGQRVAAAAAAAASESDLPHQQLLKESAGAPAGLFALGGSEAAQVDQGAWWQLQQPQPQGVLSSAAMRRSPAAPPTGASTAMGLGNGAAASAAAVGAAAAAPACPSPLSSGSRGSGGGGGCSDPGPAGLPLPLPQPQPHRQPQPQAHNPNARVNITGQVGQTLPTVLSATSATTPPVIVAPIVPAPRRQPRGSGPRGHGSTAAAPPTPYASTPAGSTPSPSPFTPLSALAPGLPPAQLVPTPPGLRPVRSVNGSSGGGGAAATAGGSPATAAAPVAAAAAAAAANAGNGSGSDSLAGSPFFPLTPQGWGRRSGGGGASGASGGGAGGFRNSSGGGAAALPTVPTADASAFLASSPYQMLPYDQGQAAYAASPRMSAPGLFPQQQQQQQQQPFQAVRPRQGPEGGLTTQQSLPLLLEDGALTGGARTPRHRITEPGGTWRSSQGGAGGQQGLAQQEDSGGGAAAAGGASGGGSAAAAAASAADALAISRAASAPAAMPFLPMDITSLYDAWACTAAPQVGIKAEEREASPTAPGGRPHEIGRGSQGGTPSGAGAGLVPEPQQHPQQQLQPHMMLKLEGQSQVPEPQSQQPHAGLAAPGSRRSDGGAAAAAASPVGAGRLRAPSSGSAGAIPPMGSFPPPYGGHWPPPTAPAYGPPYMSSPYGGGYGPLPAARYAGLPPPPRAVRWRLVPGMPPPPSAAAAAAAMAGMPPGAMPPPPPGYMCGPPSLAPPTAGGMKYIGAAPSPSPGGPGPMFAAGQAGQLLEAGAQGGPMSG